MFCVPMALQQPTSPSLRWALQIIQLATVCVQICVWHSVRSHACIHARADDSPASQSSYPNRSASPCDWPYCWVTHICWAATALHGQQMHTPYPGASLSRSPFDIMLVCAFISVSALLRLIAHCGWMIKISSKHIWIYFKPCVLMLLAIPLRLV